jgi:hypothetical protein
LARNPQYRFFFAEKGKRDLWVHNMNLKEDLNASMFDFSPTKDEIRRFDTERGDFEDFNSRGKNAFLNVDDGDNDGFSVHSVDREHSQKNEDARRMLLGGSNDPVDQEKKQGIEKHLASRNNFFQSFWAEESHSQAPLSACDEESSLRNDVGRTEATAMQEAEQRSHHRNDIISSDVPQKDADREDELSLSDLSSTAPILRQNGIRQTASTQDTKRAPVGESESQKPTRKTGQTAVSLSLSLPITTSNIGVQGNHESTANPSEIKTTIPFPAIVGVAPSPPSKSRSELKSKTPVLNSHSPVMDMESDRYDESSTTSTLASINKRYQETIQLAGLMLQQSHAELVVPPPTLCRGTKPLTNVAENISIKVCASC